MAADGTVTFSTALDNEQLEKDLKEADREIDSLKRKLSKSETEKSAIEVEMERAEAAIHETEAAINDLKEQMGSIPTAAQSADEYRAQRVEIERIGAKISEQEKKLEDQVAGIDKLNGRWQKLDAQAAGYARQLDQAKARQSELGAEYSSVYMRASRAFDGSMAAMDKRLDAFSDKVTKTLKKAFLFSFVAKAVGSLKDYLGSALAENERFSASFENLKATLSGFAQPLLSVVVPAVTSVVNMLSAMAVNLARLVDSMFKTDFAGSIQRARDAAQQAQAATDKQAKSTKKLAKATKEANSQLMAFDELNVLNAETSDDSATNLDGTVGTETGAPDWDALDVGKIDGKLAEIMLILGAALLAVGAVLAFSGINIPLGITLMAIGALMLYTAYKEAWDALPEDVRKAITGMLVVAGIVLFLLGVVLAFAGPATMAVGIGMMMAGAALLWGAVMLNWNSMPEELKGVVSALMLVLGAALLVIGAILCLSGAGTPLGIALMVAGAATLVGVAALNWESMPEEIKGIVSLLMAILGGALLVVGAILALSGANILLGVGLMMAGAVLLAGDAALNWDSIPEEMRPVINVLLALVGGALLAVGAVLAFSGTNIPLGIALIAAGAVTLAGIIALNWDSVGDNVGKVVQVILEVVGGALLAVGAILAFSGTNIPLGIALIAAGAVTLAAAANVDWEGMSDDISDIVKNLLDVVGKALLVVGAILLFSGAGIPLGVGLMLAGAAALATEAALDWDGTTEAIGGVIGDIMEIVGGALVAIGLILCLSGAGIPLGIALIVAGAGVLAFSQMDIDWDFMKDKIAEVWDGIVRFWKENIAPVFTVEWWKNLFKSIVNGLIDCINTGLNAFGDFVNLISGGIGGLLNTLGVSGFDFTVTMPQIPRLAQGAVIPPNREFMAVLGDQSNGRNLEAPEGLIRQIVREESGGIDAEALSVLYALLDAVREGKNIYMDETLMGRAVQGQLSTMARMSGA